MEACATKAVAATEGANTPTRLSAGGVTDEWVTQMLRQGDAQVLKKYSQMKLQMKREALVKLNRQANEMAGTLCQNLPVNRGSGTVLAQ